MCMCRNLSVHVYHISVCAHTHRYTQRAAIRRRPVKPFEEISSFEKKPMMTRSLIVESDILDKYLEASFEDPAQAKHSLPTSHLLKSFMTKIRKEKQKSFSAQILFYEAQIPLCWSALSWERTAPILNNKPQGKVFSTAPFLYWIMGVNKVKRIMCLVFKRRKQAGYLETLNVSHRKNWVETDNSLTF